VICSRLRGVLANILLLLGLASSSVAGGEPNESAQVKIGNFWIDRYEYPNVAGQLPRVDVSWEEAQQLCAARSQRLCTEAEWELAARGPDNFDYSYGNQFEPRRCNAPWPDGKRWIRSGDTTQSGHFAGCQSPAGVSDMVGNVWEWTDGWYDQQAGWRVVRGGSWFHNVNFARSDGRFGLHLTSNYRLDLIGFRCCQSTTAENTAHE
jgi:formylglycine-generating enzyme required for sulfatase activity